MRTLILIILTLAQAFCAFSGMMMMQGMHQELKLSEARLGADLLVYPSAASSKIDTGKLIMQGTPVPVYKNRSMLDKMNFCEGIEAVSHQIYISDTLPDGNTIWIIGYEPDTDFAISPWIEEGADTVPARGSLISGSRVAQGDNQSVTLFQREWPIGAHLEETGSVLDYSVFVSMDTLQDIIQASIEAGVDKYASIDPYSIYSVALVRLNDRSTVNSVTDWINIYVRKVIAVRSEETLTRAATSIQGTARTMVMIAALAWLVLLLALGISQSMLMKERKREIYVWHSLGASRAIVRKVLLSEAGLVHLIGAVAGVVLAFLFYAIFGGALLSGYMPSLASGLLIALISILLNVIVGVLFARSALRKVTDRLDSQMLLTV